MGRWWSWGNSQPRRTPLLISQQRHELTSWLAPDQIWGNQTPTREGDALSVSQGLGCSSPRLLGAPGLQVRVWLSSGAPTTHCLPASPWALCSCHQLGMFKCRWKDVPLQSLLLEMRPWGDAASGRWVGAGGERRCSQLREVHPAP